MKRLLNSSKSSANLPKVVAAEASYTGGGIYVFLGELSDGTYFIADYPYFDLRIVNEDPRPTYWDDDADTSAGYVPWQEAHLMIRQKNSSRICSSGYLRMIPKVIIILMILKICLKTIMIDNWNG